MVQLKLIIFFTTLLCSIKVYGFTLLSGPSEARLDINETSPTVKFALDTALPSISGKSSFLNGKYAGLSDEEFWKALINEAMGLWNDVDGSYLEYNITLSQSASLNSEDHVNSIIISEINLSAAASSIPTVEDGKIVDCDIQISNRTTSAYSLAFTLAHELGHCLGLGHNHTNYGAIMGYSRSDYTLKLGADDIAGIIYLYPKAQYEKHNAKELLSCGTINKPIKINNKIILLILLAFPICLVFKRNFSV